MNAHRSFGAVFATMQTKRRAEEVRQAELVERGVYPHIPIGAVVKPSIADEVRESLHDVGAELLDALLDCVAFVASSRMRWWSVLGGVLVLWVCVVIFGSIGVR